jgi:hypothetical protein
MSRPPFFFLFSKASTFCSCLRVSLSGAEAGNYIRSSRLLLLGLLIRELAARVMMSVCVKTAPPHLRLRQLWLPVPRLKVVPGVVLVTSGSFLTVRSASCRLSDREALQQLRGVKIDVLNCHL